MALEQRYSPMGKFQVLRFMGFRPVWGRLLLEACEHTICDFFSNLSWLSSAARFPSMIFLEMWLIAGLKGSSWRQFCRSSYRRSSICRWSSQSLSKRSVRDWTLLYAIYLSTCLLMALILGWKGHYRISSAYFYWISLSKALRFSCDRLFLCYRIFYFPNFSQISKLALFSSGWFSLFSIRQFSPREYFLFRMQEPLRILLAPFSALFLDSFCFLLLLLSLEVRDCGSSTSLA